MQPSTEPSAHQSHQGPSQLRVNLNVGLVVRAPTHRLVQSSFFVFLRKDFSFVSAEDTGLQLVYILSPGRGALPPLRGVRGPGIFGGLLEALFVNGKLFFPPYLLRACDGYSLVLVITYKTGPGITFGHYRRNHTGWRGDGRIGQ